MSGFTNGVLSADNVDFTGGNPVSEKVTSDGQLMIGSSVAPKIRISTLTAGSGISIANAAGSITLSASSTTPLSFTADSGSAAPAGNVLILNGSGSVTTSGSGNTIITALTGLTSHNVLVGAGTATITKVAPSATSGVPLISQGASSDPVFGTAVVAGGGTGAITLTSHGVLIGQATSAISATAAGSAGQVLQSGGGSADPVYSTATYPATTTINQILYSSAANVVGGLSTANQAVLTTGATGVPVLTALGLNGQLIIGSTAGVPAAATLTAGTGVTITNAANSITIASTASAVPIYTYISTGTASASASLDFTSLDNTYKAYRFVISNLILSAAQALRLKASTDNLSTFATLGASLNSFGSTTAANAPVKTTTTTTTVILALATTTGLTFNGFVDVYSIGESTKQIQANFDVSMSAASTGLNNSLGYITDTVRENINSIQFLPLSGTITSGTIILYGIS